MSFFPDRGVGVGLRSEHWDLFEKGKPASVSWVEVISENFLDWAAGNATLAARNLEKVRRNVPVALHGVSLSLGSADSVDRDYLRRLQDLIDRIDPIVVSDHLCWTGVDGENLHDLLPLPYTEEVIAHVADKISQVQDFLGRRILVENVSSYAECSTSQMPEWEFLSAILERADCGLLLDVNNVYVAAKNHGFDPHVYLRALPKHRIGQIHLAGHSNNGSHLVDTHDAPICEDVWDLYRWTAQNLPSASVMVERDANIPAWEELELELLRAGKERGASHGDEAGRRVARELAAAL